MNKLFKFKNSVGDNNKKDKKAENDTVNKRATTSPQHQQIETTSNNLNNMNSIPRPSCSSSSSSGPFHRKFLKKSDKKSLAELIRRKRWRKVSRLLFSSELDGDELLASVEEETGLNCLSLACMMHPPLKIVLKIVDISPIIVTSENAQGRTPLHFAAGWGASPHVVSFLTAMNPEAATIHDDLGKTPLIMACQHMHPRRLSDTGNTFNDLDVGPQIEVIETLVFAAPGVVADEDSSGIDALGYLLSAQQSTTPAPILKYLKTATKIDKKIRAEDISEDGKLRIYDKVRKKMKPGCTTIWDQVNLTHQQERQMHKKLSIFLSIEEEVGLDKLPLTYLDKCYPQALYAAEHGFVASYHNSNRNGIPTFVEISANFKSENISECTLASCGTCA